MSKVETSLTAASMKTAVSALRKANAAFARENPGDPVDRQPVHTVYGGAHLFRADSSVKLGELALRSLREHAPDGRTLGAALGWSRGDAFAETVYARVVAKLEREAVEDFRIDFEDGYGNRPDAEEDAEAARTAEEVAKGNDAGSLPPFIGIRIKSLIGELHGARAAHARRLRDDARAPREAAAARELRGDDPEGHDPGARLHGRPALRGARAPDGPRPPAR